MRPKSIFAVTLALLCTVGIASAQPRSEIHFPDPPGYHTLKCDLHMHTVFSDGNVWPTVRVDEAWREGLDAIAISDHIEYQPHKDDIPTNHNRPYEIAARKAEERGILFIRAAEITRDTPPGHFNAIFLDDINPLDTADFYEVFNQAHKQQAFVFWNHPGWKGPELGRWGEAQAKLLERGQLHGIEICNENDYYREAHQSAVEHNLTFIGNSDIHGPSLNPPRTPESHRTLTLVLTTDKTLPALREALDAGRTAVWYKNQLIGKRDVLERLFPACIKINPPHHRSKDTRWVRIQNHCELDIDLERIGKGGPAKITLPARATTLVRFNDGAEQASGLKYRATNFLTAPDQPLTVSLEIPRIQD
jgi:hypothetical protein